MTATLYRHYDQEGLDRDDEGYLYIAQDKGGITQVKDLRTGRW